MANEYLLKKWRFSYKCLDRQHKGQLSKDDEKQQEETFAKLTNLEGERKQRYLEASKNAWNRFFFHWKDGPVSEEEFIDMTNQDFKKDKNKYEEDIRNGCFEDLKAIDQRGDELLTEEEFLASYKAGGFENEELNKKFFEALKPVNGKLPFANMVDAWVQFFVNEDSSKRDVVLEFLEAYPDL